MGFSDDEIARRLPVWQGLSELFLDTELQAHHFDHLARAVTASGFSPREVHDILWTEVFPALADNLRVVAGEWAGFDDVWLQQRINDVLSGTVPGPSLAGLMSVDAVRRAVHQAWDEAAQRLPAEFRSGAR